MMLVIEYVNVQTKGSWHQFLHKKRWLQYFLAAALGAIPGCLGSFTVVALFSHNVVSFGALVTTMIATSGDEAFVMLAMFPGKALELFAIIFVVGILTGFATDHIFPNLNFVNKFHHRELPLHKEEKCNCFNPRGILQQIRQPSMQRVLLLILVGLLVFGILSGNIATDEKNWIRSTLLFTSLIALYIVITVPEHFLEEHLWVHIVKIHIPKIFLWTFGTLLIVHLLLARMDVNSWVQNNALIVLLVAVVIGLIPESGPHLVFVTLFATGTIPFSILLASSIVQDGHGMIPLIAESKRSFILVKSINLIVGFLAGMLGLLIGF
jgi:hypothetical protein